MTSMGSIGSLLSFLDAPIVVGDPESRVIYLNPAFERAFGRSARESAGESLAALFGGGGREAILSAVAEVCSRGETVHFRLKEGGAAYLGLASPIEADADRVGVVILLTDEPKEDERLIAFQSEVAEPLEEATQALEELLEQTGGRRAERYRMLAERGLAALERARKWNDELHRALCGQTNGRGTVAHLDPVKVVRQVVSRLAKEAEKVGVELQLLAPASLPAAAGEAAMLETALTRLMRHRLASESSEGILTLSVRSVGEGDDLRLIFGVIDHPAERDRDADDEPEPEPRAVRATVAALGGQLTTVEEPRVGRATVIQLEPAP